MIKSLYYGLSLSIMLFFASGLVFLVTEKSEYFSHVVMALFTGSVLGFSLYGGCLYYGNRLMEWMISKSANKESRIYYRIK
jgi:ABC-type nitrate/sulfonate/bicarbonate transport system permease component